MYHESSYVWDLILAHLVIISCPGFGPLKFGCDSILLRSIENTGSLSSAALSKVLLSVMTAFTESRTLGTRVPNTRRTEMLGKGPSVAIYSWRPLTLSSAGPWHSTNLQTDTGQNMICWMSTMDTRQSIFLFFSFPNQTYPIMFLHYVDLRIPFWHNYKSDCYNY
jgi:hypothetical protein